MGKSKQQPTNPISQDVVTKLGEIVGHTFKDTRLVCEALTHSSAKTETHPSNERLEFFGDAILGLIVTEMIFNEFPDFPEGEMTRVKSVLVSRETLAIKAKQYGMQDYIILGKGVAKHDKLPRSILANVFEAILAALYIDGDYQPCVKFLYECFRGDVATIVTQQATRNYKSALQQLIQSHFGDTPTYAIVSESGPDHNKRFKVAAVINGKQYEAGEGASKKEAEQLAALTALKTVLSTLDLGDEDAELLLELEDEDDIED